MGWNLIDVAPKDGSFVIGATECNIGRQWTLLRFPYPLKVRWNGDRWEADDGRVYDPQPTHFRALAAKEAQ